MDHLLPLDTSAEPTLHELESRAAAAGWQKIREDILDVVTENSALPPDQVSHKSVSVAIILIQLHIY